MSEQHCDSSSVALAFLLVIVPSDAHSDVVTTTYVSHGKRSRMIMYFALHRSGWMQYHLSNITLFETNRVLWDEVVAVAVRVEAPSFWKYKLSGAVCSAHQDLQRLVGNSWLWKDNSIWMAAAGASRNWRNLRIMMIEMLYYYYIIFIILYYHGGIF